MSTPSAVGMNLAAPQYYGTEFPFIDRMKNAGTWAATGVDPSQYVIGADGLPDTLPAQGGALYTIVNLDPESANTPDRYVLTYTGTAQFSLPGVKVISSTPGRLVFDYNAASSMQMLVVKGITASDPLTSIHLVRQDQEDLFNHGEIFNPAFLEKDGGFDTFRFMDWNAINNSTVTSWSQRTTLDTMSWAANGNLNSTGVPIEAMVALANKTHTNMWLNVPANADDDFVRQMMTYVRDHLDPTLKVNLEYSNEMWNFSFQQTKDAAVKANELWGKDVNHDGVIDPKNNAEAVTGGFVQYYGYRSAQVAAIAKQVFGVQADLRLNDVLATQSGYTGLENFIFQGVARANVGTVSSLFDTYAVTTYFGAQMRGLNAADRTTILSWVHGGEAGLTAAFNELMHGGTLQNNVSLDSLIPAYKYQAAVAAKYGMDLVAYEGGSDMAANQFAASDQADVMAFFTKLEQDPRMGDVYTKMVADFSAVGGKELNVLTDATPDRVYGRYGTLKSIYDDYSPAFSALLEAQKLVNPTKIVLAEAAVADIHIKAAHDFNGDGRSDILWRNDNGQLFDWLGQANGAFADNRANSFTSVATSWHIAGTGDFNGDGRADLVWRNDNGQLSTWLGQANGGFADNGANSFASVPTSWHITGTGDFNGDGRADLVWRNDNGQLSTWLGQANGGFADNGANSLTSVAANWHIAGTGDFDGDGRADLVWRSDSGQLSIWLGQTNGSFADNGANSLTTVSTDWHIAGTGDFNGDGRADILWRNDSGQLSDWLGQANGRFFDNGTNFFASAPANWQIVSTGDFNGDGRDDIFWRSDSGQMTDWLGQANGGFVDNGANFFSSVSTTTLGTANVGMAAKVNITVIRRPDHDFNGDGRSDILWRNENGQLSDWLGQANGGFADNGANFSASVPADWRVADTGDFNGDGRSDILWRNVNGQLSNWLGQTDGGFVDNGVNSFATISTSWHIAGTGDFNGDGRSDILWRNDNGQLSDWLGQANGGFADNGANSFATVSTNWHIAGTGDFNGDGRSDILWRNDNGQLSDWLGQADGGFVDNAINSFATVPTSWHVAGTGDFNGDCRADILWRNDNGQLTDWLGQANGGFFDNGANFFTSVPTAWQVEGTGDFNGDGRADILWRNDNGQLSDWLGQANGGFVDNGANSFGSVPTSWHMQAHNFLI